MRNLIQSRISEMTPNQVKIARFILDFPEEAAFMTATRLATRVGVSESTVVRFAFFLGFPGYGEMRGEISKTLLDTLSTLRRIDSYRTEASNGYLDRVMAMDVDTLLKLRSQIPRAQIESFADMAVQAESIFIAATRSSFVLGYYLHYYLSWVRKSVTLLPEVTAYEVLQNAPADSLVIGITFPRYSRWTVDILAHSKEKGLKTAAITDDIESPLVPFSSHVVYVPFSPISFLDSFTAPLCMINCLIISISMKYGDTLKERFASLENLWKLNRTYISPSPKSLNVQPRADGKEETGKEDDARS